MLRWFAPLLLAGACLVPGAYAQRGGGRDEISRGVREDVGPGLETHPTAALPYAVAGFSLLIVLVIVCMPSRKMMRD